jgi:branched-chain amino acid aminotransferase
MAFDYSKQLAYFREDFVPFPEATLSLASSPVLYGLAVYTVLTYNWNEKKGTGYFFRLADHYKRLAESAKIMDFTPLEQLLSWADFENIARELVTRNNIHEDALLRATLFIDEQLAGTKMHGLKTSLSAFIYPMTDFLPPSGAHLGIASWRRTPDNAIPSRAKVTGSYANAALMKNEALQNGYDDAISLDEQGHVAESTVANIFMIRAGVLVTPHAGTDILEGITRDTLLQLARKLGIACEERNIDRSELYLADEVLVCGSSARITPVLSIDHRPIGAGRPGKLTQQLAKLYDEVTHGKLPDYATWRTPLL